MKRRTVLLTITALVILALMGPVGLEVDQGVSRAPALAWAAAPPTPQEKKPSWKSREEYDAFQAMANEKDPSKKVALGEAFLQKFANTDFKDLVYLAMMQAYQQLRDAAKAMDAGNKALEANPDNLDALTLTAYLFPFAFKADDPEAANKLGRAEANAKHALEVLQKQTKPEGVAEEQFNQAIKARRALFNSTAGFVSLQRKDYAQAATMLRAAAEDNPSDVYTFYRLGLAYLYSSPPDYGNAVWNLARSVALAKAAQDPQGVEIEKFLKRAYSNYHGNEEGLPEIMTQVAASPTPPEGFTVSAMEAPAATGNASIDAFNQTFFYLKFGGDRAQKIWESLKGQPFGVGGFVDSVEKGTDPGAYLIRIDVLSQSKQADGVYDVELKDSTQPNVKNLSKGDPVRFQGTIAAYTVDPSFILTLDPGEINADDVPDQPKVQPKPKPRTAPRRRRPPA